ncbi:pre-toxin TG domain-containing protein, partial [Streptococcus oralis]|uniref:pre-toxin TG domain-containing protein n=1 Tax=Streptococcus oralis TaxID=1303 RepID=UPI001F3922F8
MWYNWNIDTTGQKSYNLVEILDGKASPIQAAKDVYDDRIKAVKEMMAKKDQLSDEQIKALEGKSAEEIVAVRYPGQLPDYQRLKASRYYEENKESLQYVDIALKAIAVFGMIGGAVLAPATGGTSLTVSYASMAYLAADSAYSAATGHTMITGNQLSTEDRVWAGIDAAVTLVSMGSVGYLAKLAKSGKNGSTVLKGLATAGKHADDANDVSKVVYSFATDQDPNAALQNLVLGQVMGLGMKSAGNYIGKKF